MTTREKILVGLMIVAIVVGGYLLLAKPSPSGPPPTETAPQDRLNKMVVELSAALEHNDNVQTQRRILQLAETPWSAQLFLASQGQLGRFESSVGDAAKPPSNVAFTYSGYVATPGHKVAVINGLEYLQGERLDASGYVVQRIESKQVFIGTEDISIRIPLEGSEDQPAAE
jgi:hypothetical protein